MCILFIIIIININIQAIFTSLFFSKHSLLSPSRDCRCLVFSLFLFFSFTPWIRSNPIPYPISTRIFLLQILGFSFRSFPRRLIGFARVSEPHQIWDRFASWRRFRSRIQNVLAYGGLVHVFSCEFSIRDSGFGFVFRILRNAFYDEWDIVIVWIVPIFCLVAEKKM